MTIKDGALAGALIGFGVWGIYRTAEWIFSFETLISQYGFQTCLILVFCFAVVGGIIGME